MPIAPMEMRERPSESPQCEPGCDCWILINVDLVIVVDEFMANRLTEDYPGDSSQKRADSEYLQPWSYAGCATLAFGRRSTKIPMRSRGWAHAPFTTRGVCLRRSLHLRGIHIGTRVGPRSRQAI